ncbi:hypothetical protein Krac_0240 [Ktedonobacter racemifer DSM 44963]|uniref:Uncharacterized protein n=1 Tax=Ktedonobacter racemifer DSM 44963 TaxID=485913 RepID=D6U782_KTERA|nr:hypothetical protein Krac_0240 [Ktedonobacter racemifer DSM 44963]
MKSADGDNKKFGHERDKCIAHDLRACFGKGFCLFAEHALKNYSSGSGGR